ncbi:MAG: hypothetical protein R3F59_19800 [Myxococcota bacterium]
MTRAVDRADVAFTAGGRLLEAAGAARLDCVVAGQVLATLDAAPSTTPSAGADAAVDDLTARLAQLERDRDRSWRWPTP